jgi:transcriptional regulator with XRE-family HTH domain
MSASSVVEETEFRHPGPFVAAARVRRGLTQQALAARCGLKQSDVSKLERGLRWPSLPQLLRLAHALELPLQWFLTGSTRPPLDSGALGIELLNLGIVDLLIADARVPGAFRPPEQVLAWVVSGDQPDPRLVEAIPAVLAWNPWNPRLLEAYGLTCDARAAHRLGWLADVALTIHRVRRFPGGFAEPLRVAEFMNRMVPSPSPDSLGHPAVCEVLPPVSKRWNITYAASLETFRARAKHLQELRAAAVGEPGWEGFPHA